MSVKCILTGQTPSVLDGVTENVQTQIDDKQPKITADGILKGDGNSNISAAVKGTDYDTEIGIVHYEDSFDSVEAAYNKSKRLFCSENPADYVGTDSDKLYALLNRSQPYISDGRVEIKYTFTCLDKTITLTRTKRNSTATPVDTWAKGSQAFNPRLHASTHKTGGSDAIAPSDIGAQTKITANGILKGDGKGNITAADLPIRAETITIPKGRMRGDVDGDGKITENDALQIRQHNKEEITLTGADLWCADINGDGNIKSIDVTLIRQYLSGAPTPLTSAPTFADYYNNWTYVKVDDLTGYWTTEISIAGLTTSNNVVVNICETFLMGQFYKAEVSTGKVKIYATTPPITDIPAIVVISSGSGKGSIPSYLNESSVQPEVFIATYGETTLAEIYAAYQAGKAVNAVAGNTIYALDYIASSQAFFTRVGNNVKDYIKCLSTGWSSGQDNMIPSNHSSTHASGGSDPITPADVGAQPTISANGILKGDGSGNITAASETEVELVSLPNICNPNLLDNWYFGNPVNQRGQTEYPASNGVTYTVDRWIQNSSGVKINDGYTTIGGAGGIFERIENIDMLVGKLLTFSVLTTDGLYTGTVTFNKADVVFLDRDNLIMLYNSFFNGFQIAPREGVKNIVAVKLELGSQQTLAHQENGAWVLNEIPDYGEQLLKCQRYLRPAALNFIVSNSSGNYYASAIMQSPYPMRTVPAIVNGDYTAAVIREVTGGQTATVSQVFTPSVYGGLTIQLTPEGNSIPNYVYIDPTGFNPLLSAEL